MGLCPKCSRELPADLAGGLCPSCLLLRGLEVPTAVPPAPGPAGGSAGGSSEPAVTQTWTTDIAAAHLATLLPQYDAFEYIGRGGMGVVYRARQRNLDRVVALKVLSPEVASAPGFAERFAREARAMARLNHPNIVTVYDYGSVRDGDAEVCYLTMELVDGSNLRGMLRQLSAEQALAIVPQICEALQYAHDIGIVHRDVKPENILVDKRGRVKIADFGLAKLLSQARAPTDYTLTQPDRAMGTPSYMAPEQLERPTEVDHRADVYSLGVVFYEMLTGQLPNGRFPLPSERVQVDVRLDEVVLKALEHDVERRYQHVSEVRTRLETVSGPAPASARATPPVGTTPPVAAAQPAGAARPVAAPATLPAAPTTRESPWFYSLAFGAYAGCWATFLALLNLGWVGLGLTAALFTFVAWRHGKYLLTLRPEIVRAKAAAAPWRRRWGERTSIGSLALGMMLVLVGIALQGDGFSTDDTAKIFTGRELTETTRGFLKNAQAYDPKSLNADVRDLTLRTAYAFYPVGLTRSGNDNAPDLRTLMFKSKMTASDNARLAFAMICYPSAIPPEFRQISLWVMVALGLYFFVAGVANILSTKGYQLSGLAWRPAGSLLGMLIMAYVIVFTCASAAFESVRSAHVAAGKIALRTNEFQTLCGVSGSDDRLFQTLDQWAIDHGYSLAAVTKGTLEDSHRLPAVSTGVTYEAAVLWKPRLFERLATNSEGMYCKAPELLVQCTRSAAGSYLWITLPVWPHTNAESEAGQATQRDLYQALNREFGASATRSATAPWSEIDLSTPRGLLRAYASLSFASDPAAIRALCCGTDDALNMVGADDNTDALFRLNDALHKTFGANHPDIVSRLSEKDLVAVRPTISEAPVFDTADADVKRAYPANYTPRVWTLRRVNGAWKVDWAATFLPAGYAAQPGDAELLHDLNTRPVDEITRDVYAGKFKGYDDAVDAWHRLQGDWAALGEPLRDAASRNAARNLILRYQNSSQRK